MIETDDEDKDRICRVCRAEESSDSPLFHPCLCTGSIRFVHQDCLTQWLKHSKKEFCEVCKHKFVFRPIYREDMPHHLPVIVLLTGLGTTLFKAVRLWLHYTLVALAWLFVVPLAAYRIHKCVFFGIHDSWFALFRSLFSPEHLLLDIIQGFAIVVASIAAFIALAWLREQIINGGTPEWLNIPEQQQPARNIPEEPEQEEQQDAIAQPAAEVPAMPAVDNGGADILERAAEELTWDRMLGLDGSLIFLEHIFWVVVLNTGFMFLFVFCPYHIGKASATLLNIQSKSFHLEAVGQFVAGYCVIGVLSLAVFGVVRLTRWQKAATVFGVAYIIIKVALLIFVEVGVFPLLNGWWIDLCTLSLFGSSLSDRISNFHIYPITSVFVHWIVGMVFVFYYASFILILREILRPGVLWFIRDFSEADFNPIHEMIHLPVLRHVRRFLVSFVIFGMTILLVFLLPIRSISKFLPGFLPYHVTMMTEEAPVSELSLELLSLQVILPALLDQGHIHAALKFTLFHWLKFIGNALSLRSYLLGEQNEWPLPTPADRDAQLPNPDGGLQAAHLAFLQAPTNTRVVSYTRPNVFPLRLMCFLTCVSFTLYCSSCFFLVLPIFIGRFLMRLWMQDVRVHELYTCAFGLYFVWGTARLAIAIAQWASAGWVLFSDRILKGIVIGFNTVVSAVFLLGIIPLLMGLLFDLVVVMPIRLFPRQSALFFPWQSWALGVLHVKIFCAITLIGPRWWLKTSLELVINNGFKNNNLKITLCQLAFPLIAFLTFLVCIPYFVAFSLLGNLTSFDLQTQNMVFQKLYPSLFTIALLIMFCLFQFTQIRHLYRKIKNEQYLVGKMLVNFDRP